MMAVMEINERAEYRLNVLDSRCMANVLDPGPASQNRSGGELRLRPDRLARNNKKGLSPLIEYHKYYNLSIDPQ
jgi:hypothetical protein